MVCRSVSLSIAHTHAPAARKRQRYRPNRSGWLTMGWSERPNCSTPTIPRQPKATDCQCNVARVWVCKRCRDWAMAHSDEGDEERAGLVPTCSRGRPWAGSGRLIAEFAFDRSSDRARARRGPWNCCDNMRDFRAGSIDLLTDMDVWRSVDWDSFFSVSRLIVDSRTCLP